MDRDRHADSGAVGGRGGGGQAVPGSPSVHADGTTGRETARRGAGGGQGSELEAVVLGHHMVDFWTNVCVCHTLIVEESPEGAGPPIYQVRSRGSFCVAVSNLKPCFYMRAGRVCGRGLLCAPSHLKS